MKTIWFKTCYVDPILSGEKTDTIRRRSARYRVGEIVGLSIGARAPFATAKIIGIDPIALEDIEPARRAALGKMIHATHASPLDYIRFNLIERGRKNGD